MSLPILVLDASVIVKWFLNEKRTANDLALKEQYVRGEINIIVPELLFYEVSNALLFSNVFSMNELFEVNSSLWNFGLETIIWNVDLAD